MDEDRIGGRGEPRLVGRLDRREPVPLAFYGDSDMSTPPNTPTPTPAPVAMVEVPYQDPRQRAKTSAYRASWAQLLALSVALAIIPALITFLSTGDWSTVALVSLAQGLGQAVLGVIFQFLLKLQDATKEDTPPSSRTGE